MDRWVEIQTEGQTDRYIDKQRNRQVDRMCECVCVCVCVWEREREGQREWVRESEREWEREKLNWFEYILPRAGLLILCKDRYFCVFCHPWADESSVSLIKIGVNPMLAHLVCNAGCIVYTRMIWLVTFWPLVTLKIRSHGPKSNQVLRNPQGVSPPSFIKIGPGILVQLSTQDSWQTDRWADGWTAWKL